MSLSRCKEFFLNTTSQPSSQNFPIESKDELFNAGKTYPVWAVLESWLERGMKASEVACAVSAFGRVTTGAGAMFGVAISAGKPETTFWALSGYYVSCGFLNFWYYVRPGCEKPGV